MDNICKICGSGDYHRYSRFGNKNREVVVCKGCATLRTFPYPEVDYGEQEFYCEHYMKNEKLFRTFARDMVGIVARHKQRGRLLDIGCSVGFILEEARKVGFDPSGVELNKKAAEIASSKGFSVKCRDINNAGFGKNSFDVIILNHMLEHVLEPSGFLQDVRKILNRNGILAIGVPNHNSLAAGMFRTRWYGWGIPEHVWHFDKNSLAGLLSRNGFRIKESIQNSQYYPFSKSLRKNAMAVAARIGNTIGAGDQLIVISS